VLVARMTGRAGRKARPLPPAARMMAARVGMPARRAKARMAWPAPGGAPYYAAEPRGGVGRGLVASGPGTLQSCGASEHESKSDVG
jgi:hypothetical protein